MQFIPLRHRSFQLMLLILSLYMVHAHYSELDTIYAFAQLYLLYSYTITVYYYLYYIVTTCYIVII